MFVDLLSSWVNILKSCERKSLGLFRLFAVYMTSVVSLYSINARFQGVKPLQLTHPLFHTLCLLLHFKRQTIKPIIHASSSFSFLKFDKSLNSEAAATRNYTTDLRFLALIYEL